LAFDRAIDSMLLKIPCRVEDNGARANDLPGAPKIEFWVRTQDKKLVRLCHSIHSSTTTDSCMGRLCVDREDELRDLLYWRYVDNLASDVLLSRMGTTRAEGRDILELVNSAIQDIESNLNVYFESANGK
ncbi:TPA: hypothetical protein ACGUVR_004030, partial [Vibrio vulnificus]